MSASRNRWAPGLKVAAFACVLCAPLSDSSLARNTIRGTRSTLRGCRVYSFGTETRRGCSILLHHQLSGQGTGPVCSNALHALKFIVADDTDVQAHRLNRTSSAAQRNAENLLVVRKCAGALHAARR